MTLDPRTANPHLFLSLDQKTVTYLDHAQPLLDNPERFDAELFVLGCQGFRSGKHSWVVNVEQGQNWAIGIAQESMRRKGSLSLSPQQGIWAVQQCWGQLQGLTSCWTSLFLLRKPKRIRVDLDYEGGWVAFFDAELDAPIFTFPPTSFKQERIHPWFWVPSGSQLTLCPWDYSGHFWISAVWEVLYNIGLNAATWLLFGTILVNRVSREMTTFCFEFLVKH